MRQNPDAINDVLIVGLGLIGTSIAIALHEARPALSLHGLEPRQAHREALPEGVFTSVTEDWPAAGEFDLVILAVPGDAVVALLPKAARCARLVMDVSSVKHPICREAERLGLRARFAPTHPMTGLAAAGPASARADLFRGKTWLTIRGWPAVERVVPLLHAVGADWREVDSSEEHDAAMACVSHGIHLTSLAAVLAATEAAATRVADWADWTGPGFCDVTRLAASPPGFWPYTLVANRQPVLDYVHRLKNVLMRFEAALERGDEVTLHSLLVAAQTAHATWMKGGSL